MYLLREQILNVNHHTHRNVNYVRKQFLTIYMYQITALYTFNLHVLYVNDIAIKPEKMQLTE